MDDLNWCKSALAHAEKTDWQAGIEHYRERVLAAEYKAWAIGDLSEISDEAMCYGSDRYRQAYPERCGPTTVTAPARDERPEGGE